MNKGLHIAAPPPSAPSALLKTKTAYSLWFKIYNDFPKSHRILGRKIEDYFLSILENIFVSVYLSPEQKLPKLAIAISKLDGVKFFLQIAWENKCIVNDKYILLSEKLNEVGRMLGGWRKGLIAKTLPRKAEEKIS